MTCPRSQGNTQGPVKTLVLKRRICFLRNICFKGCIKHELFQSKNAFCAKIRIPMLKAHQIMNANQLHLRWYQSEIKQGGIFLKLKGNIYFKNTMTHR